MTQSLHTFEIGNLADQIANHVIEILKVKQRPTSPWMTPDDAGQYLRLKRRGLVDMRARGTGPKFHKVNDRVVRYHVRDLGWRFLNRIAQPQLIQSIPTASA